MQIGEARERSSDARKTPMRDLVQSCPDMLAMQRPFLYRYALAKLRRVDTAEEVCRRRC